MANRKSEMRFSYLKTELFRIIDSQTTIEVDLFIRKNKILFCNNFDLIHQQLILNIDSALSQSNTLHALRVILEETPINPPLSEEIFSKLFNLLINSPDIDLKELAMNCLLRLNLSMSQISQSMLCQLLTFSTILSDNNDVTLGLRSIYLQCLGSAIIISGDSLDYSAIRDANYRAFSFFSKDKIELREAAYNYFSLVITKFMNETYEYFDRLIEEIIKSFEVDVYDYECDNEDENDFNNYLDEERVCCQPAFLNEKSAALQLISSMSRVYPLKIIERFSQIEKVLDYSFNLENSEFSWQCIDTSYKLLKILYANSIEQFKQFWYNKIIHTYTQMLAKEESKETVTNILIKFEKLLKFVGKNLIPQVYIGVIIKQIICLLQDSAGCQKNTEESQEILMDKLTLLIFEMVKLWKIEFSPRIKEIFTLYLKKSELSNDIEIVNIFIGEMGNLISEFRDLAFIDFDTLFNRLEAIFQAEEDLVYRNAVFTLGILCEVTGDNFQRYPQFLSIISWLLENDTTPGVVDNGIAALCRAILASPSSIPKQYFLIVLINLPLREDFNETKIVFKFLCYLLESQEIQDFELVLKMIIDGIADNAKDCKQFLIENEDLCKVQKYINKNIKSDMLERILQRTCEENKICFKNFLSKVNFKG